MQDDDSVNVPQPDRWPLIAEDIPWQQIPVALTLEQMLELDWEGLGLYAAELREDLMATRELLHEALTVAAQLTVRLQQSQETVIRLHDALRAQRAA